MAAANCVTCGWPKPERCVCPDGDYYYDKLVTTEQMAQIERIKAMVDVVFGPRIMQVSYFPYSHIGDPGPCLYIGFSSHERIKLVGHKHVLDAAEALLRVYMDHPMIGGPWEQGAKP